MMSITEAQAVNDLLRWIFEIVDQGREPRGAVLEDAGWRAAVALSRAAHKRLMAGVDPDEVNNRWPGWPE